MRNRSLEYSNIEEYEGTKILNIYNFLDSVKIKALFVFKETSKILFYPLLLDTNIK